VERQKRNKLLNVVPVVLVVVVVVVAFRALTLFFVVCYCVFFWLALKIDDVGNDADDVNVNVDEDFELWPELSCDSCHKTKRE